VRLTISNKNNNSKKDLIEFPHDSYNSSGVDVGKLSKNEKNRLISILKDEFLINSSQY